MGLHFEEILSQDEEGRAEESVRNYNAWKTDRAARVESGSRSSLNVFLATDGLEAPAGYAERVQVIRMPRRPERPTGTRFGSLVHIVLRDAEFSANRKDILDLAQTHGRLLAASEDEIQAAADAVYDALQHSVFARVRAATQTHRELPITVRTENGIFEGIIDLAFIESGKWVIADFKTDVEKPDRQIRYRRQVGWYVHAMERITGASASGCILHV
jgi:ATP-dependent exoDNAse (exonuclease V) beta subunit